MVLENVATSSEPDSAFSESIPSSDIDPYASDGNPTYASSRSSSFVKVSQTDGAPPLFVDLEELPRRWSLIGQKPHPSVIVDGIRQSCQIAQSVLRRPVRQDEADAFAFHFAKSLRMGSFGSPAGLVVGTGLWYRGYDRLRFPGFNLFTEGGRFKRDSFFGLVRGRNGFLCWQAARLCAYWGVFGFIGQIFFGTYAVSVSLAGRSMDPRLKDFNEALKQRMKDGHGFPKTDAGGQSQDSRQSGTTQNETYEMMRQRKDVQSRWKKDIEQKTRRGGYDDMSPTGGAFGQEYGDSTTDTGILSDEQMRAQEMRQRPEDRPSVTESNSPAQSQQRSSQRQKDSMQTPSSKPAGAWDRLRQAATDPSKSQAAPTAEQDAERKLRSFRSNAAQQRSASGYSGQNDRNESTMAGDSFSFSQSDEERQLAKSEAQQDFDRRIEQERAGKDFNSSDKGRRW